MYTNKLYVCYCTLFMYDTLCMATNPTRGRHNLAIAKLPGVSTVETMLLHLLQTRAVFEMKDLNMSVNLFE